MKNQSAKVKTNMRRATYSENGTFLSLRLGKTAEKYSRHLISMTLSLCLSFCVHTIALADYSILEDPMIPPDEFAILVDPLTQEQLLKEAEALQKIIQAKVQEISTVELKVLRDNKKITEIRDRETSDDESSQLGASEEETGSGNTEDRVDADKSALLENETRLREERTMLIDNMRIILDELVTKTDNNDSEMQSVIFNHRLYLRAVSGIHVDVSDTTSAWVILKGWALSKQGGLRWLTNIARFLGFLLLVWALSRLVGYIARVATRGTRLSQLQREFLEGSLKWLTLVFGIIWSMTALQLSLAPILTMLGAAGLVIALAMQDSLSNVASGLMILFFRPFDVEDIVDAGGVSGRIESMTLVSTNIKTFDNKLMVVPNSRIWSDVITNATGVTQRRVDLEFGIGYDDDIEKAESILKDIVCNHPKVLDDPKPSIRLKSLGDSSVNFICRPWASPDDYWDVYFDVTREVKIQFDKANINIPFPQRDVNLYVRSGSPDIE